MPIYELTGLMNVVMYGYTLKVTISIPCLVFGLVSQGAHYSITLVDSYWYYIYETNLFRTRSNPKVVSDWLVHHLKNRGEYFWIVGTVDKKNRCI